MRPIDRIPARAGDLTATSASLRIARSIGDLVAEYEWSPPADRIPLANGIPALHIVAAELRCEKDAGKEWEDDVCKGVRVGTHRACFSKEKPRAKSLADGAMVSWRGCFLRFKPGALPKANAKTIALRSAAALAAWIDQFDDGRQPPAGDLAANRRAIAAIAR